jgi:hypothetical protein
MIARLRDVVVLDLQLGGSMAQMMRRMPPPVKRSGHRELGLRPFKSDFASWSADRHAVKSST